MLNNFCLHVYAQQSVFIGQNVNEVFFDILSTQLLFVFRTYFTIVHIKIKYTICGGKNWETPEEKPPANTYADTSVGSTLNCPPVTAAATGDFSGDFFWLLLTTAIESLLLLLALLLILDTKY